MTRSTGLSELQRKVAEAFFALTEADVRSTAGIRYLRQHAP